MNRERRRKPSTTPPILKEPQPLPTPSSSTSCVVYTTSALAHGAHFRRGESYRYLAGYSSSPGSSPRGEDATCNTQQDSDPHQLASKAALTRATQYASARSSQAAKLDVENLTLSLRGASNRLLHDCRGRGRPIPIPQQTPTRGGRAQAYDSSAA